MTSEGTANAATLQGLKGQLANENLANIATQDPRLAAAVNGSGTSNPNFSVGTGTVAEANALGQSWVGEGATLVSNQAAPVTIVPDAFNDTTIVEVKDVANLSNSNQFRGYLATGNPIQLIVSPNTKTISQPLQNLIGSSGGSIRVFNPTTGTFSTWKSK